MEVWVLGFIVDEAEGEEATNWYLEGLFFSQESALHAFQSTFPTMPESFFVAPVLVGEVLHQDIMEIPGFEYIKNSSSTNI